MSMLARSTRRKLNASAIESVKYQLALAQAIGNHRRVKELRRELTDLLIGQRALELEDSRTARILELFNL